MNREIKFRAWHTKADKMFSAEEMGQDELTINPDGRGFVNVSGKSQVLSLYVPEMIPLQYTGLKDKNGKEIYEGDIVQFKENYTNNPTDFTIGVITYDEEYAGFTIKSNQYQYGIGEDTESFDIYSQVIGNIYENPELLTNN